MWIDWDCHLFQPISTKNDNRFENNFNEDNVILKTNTILKLAEVIEQNS